MPPRAPALPVHAPTNGVPAAVPVQRDAVPAPGRVVREAWGDPGGDPQLAELEEEAGGMTRLKREWLEYRNRFIADSDERARFWARQGFMAGWRAALRLLGEDRHNAVVFELNRWAMELGAKLQACQRDTEEVLRRLGARGESLTQTVARIADERDTCARSHIERLSARSSEARP